MLIYGYINSPSLNIVGGAAQLAVPCGVAFDNAGSAVNDSTNVYVAGNNLSTAVLLNEAVRKGISDYVNSTYGLHTSSLDVILVSGAV